MAASAGAPPAQTGSAPRHGRRQFGNPEASSEKTVYVLRSGHPEPLEIKTGLSDGTLTEIVSGDLKEGDQVAVEAIVAGKPSPSGPSGQTPRMGRMF
jgi:HlyD family secretion protein